MKLLRETLIPAPCEYGHKLVDKPSFCQLQTGITNEQKPLVYLKQLPMVKNIKKIKCDIHTPTHNYTCTTYTLNKVIPLWGKTTGTVAGNTFNAVDGVWIIIEYALTATFANNGKISYPRINTPNSIRC